MSNATIDEKTQDQELFPVAPTADEVQKTTDAWNKLLNTEADTGTPNPFKIYQEACERNPENTEFYTRALVLSLTSMASELAMQLSIFKMLLSASGGQNPFN